MANGNWITFGTHAYALPDDTESDDVEEIGNYIEKHMNAKYPKPSLEIFSTFDKQYWLPALKVLDRKNNKFFSPSYTAEWVGRECFAACQESAEDRHLRMIRVAYGVQEDKQPRHEAPDDNCDCGIYGSVNLEEISKYFQSRVPSRVDINLYDYLNEKNKILCIIEPYPDAKTIICRKGWKTSHAFISEIVYETISPREASQLLSMVWNRTIDVERIYENR